MRVILDEQGGLVEHDLDATLVGLGDRSRACCRDPRMRDPPQVRACRRIGERDRAEPLPIEAPVLIPYYLARRDARAAESDGLENHCGASHRGFKSHSLRRERAGQRQNLVDPVSGCS